MLMKKIVITEFMDQVAVDALSTKFAVVYNPQLVDAPQMLLEQIQEADALIVRNRTQVRGALLAQGHRLQAIGRLGVGLDNIDLQVCEQRGISVFPATGANNIAVAEYVLAALFILFRHVYHAQEAMLEGTWPRTQLMGQEVFGKTLGLIGLGTIAREVAKRAHTMGMEIVAYDPYLSKDDPAWKSATRMDFSALLTRADAISLHVPLTQETQHFIDAKAIATMKPGGILINTARGGIVDETALVQSLQAKRLGGAALDVFESEPLTSEAGQRFANTANLILTPHIAGVTQESNRRVSALIAKLIEDALQE